MQQKQLKGCPQIWVLSNQRGSVFILVLWTLFLLSIYALGLGKRVYQDINVAAYFQNQDRARFISEGAVKFAESSLALDDNEFDALNEYWSIGRSSDDSESHFKFHKMGDGTYSFIKDTDKRDEWLLKMAEMIEKGDDIEEKDKITQGIFGIIDEERKVNINKASVDVIRSLLLNIIDEMTFQTAEEISNSIIDWRDTDTQTRVNGAEDVYYQLLEQPYDCKDSDFQILEELLLVKGVTLNIFQQIEGFLTVYGDGAINLNTAGEEVLLSLGFNNNFVDRLINYRDGADNIEGTEDDQILNNTKNLVETLKKGMAIFEGDEKQLEAYLSDKTVGITSENFTVYIESQVGKRKLRIASIVNRHDGLQFWREL